MKLSGKIRRAVSVLLISTMVFSLVGCNSDESTRKESKEDKAQREFDEYCDELFADSLSDNALNIHFTVKDYEKYGITLDEITLGNVSVDEIEDGYKEIEDIIKKLEEFDTELLTERQNLSLKTLLAYYNKELAYKDTYLMQNEFGPNSGYIANISTNFIEFTFDDEDDVDMYLTLLKDTLRYTDEIIAYVELQQEAGYYATDYCIDENVAMIDKYFDAEINPLLASFEEKVENLNLSDDKTNEYIAMNEDYVENYYDVGYEKLREFLLDGKGKCQNDGGLCNYENGYELYSAILAEKTSCNMTPEETGEFLDEMMESLLTEYMTLYYADNSIAEKYMSLDFGMTEPEEILDYLKEAITAEFPEPYTKNYTVNYQNKAAEVEGTLAYYVTARLDVIDYNSIKVNGSAFENTSSAQLYSTLAHEGYPGHLYQFTGVYGNEEIPNICKTLNFIGFTEGYAEYAADRAYYLMCDEDLARFTILNDLYGYILQSRCDVGINGEGWTREDNAAYLADFGNEAIADEIYDMCVSDPGLLLPYTVGHILMMDLRDKAERKLKDNFDAKEFNQLIIDTGLVDFEILEEVIDDYISEKKAALNN